MGINVSLFKEAGAESYLPKGDIGVWTPEEFKSALEAVKGLDNCYPFAVFANSQQEETTLQWYEKLAEGQAEE